MVKDTIEPQIKFVRQVWCAKRALVNLITIPANQGIYNGDYVIIQKYTPKMKNGACPKCKKKYNDHTISELDKCGLIKKMM